jgi:outer membrane protein OmpA-like peptidoglycan-associated protein
VRRNVRSVDINTINFDSGSWIVPAAATGKLQALATAIKRTVARNPNTVFLVEGFTDATGNPADNLSLSDRRAQSVAAILSKDFGVPPENLTTQGYGQQDLKENTQGPSAINRRVVVQNITPLLAAGGQPPR